MDHKSYRQRAAVHHYEPRHKIDLPAQMIFDDRDPIDASLTNLSRHGFRLCAASGFPAGTAFALKVADWRLLRGQVVWNDGRYMGCLFIEPPTSAVFATMVLSADAVDRASLQSLIASESP